MNEERAEALERARRWCAEVGAIVRWDEEEERCEIGVSSPDGDVVEGAGPGYYEAYVDCRVKYEAIVAPEGPPSWF